MPYSDQEHEIERVRDRVRVRLNLIDLDFRNLHVQIEKLYQDGQAPQKTQEVQRELERLQQESQSDDDEASEELDEHMIAHAEVLRENRRLMEMA